MSVCSISSSEATDHFHEYEFFKLSNNEDYLDVGAYDGDTVKSFLAATGGAFNSITAIEPDKSLYLQLENCCNEIDSERIKCLCIGLSDTDSRATLKIEDNKYMNIAMPDGDGELELRTIDSLNQKISLIKISVFDPEIRCRIIRGGAKALACDKPKMVIQSARGSDNILDIPNEIWKINPEYNIYFRIMVYEQKGILRFNTAYWAV